MRIDAIYRRAVTSELVQELQKTPEHTNALLSTLSALPPSPHPVQGALALLSALVEQRVCMIGSFKTQVAHSKACFCMLNHPATLAFLSEKEKHFVREHVPYTTWLKADFIDVSAIKREKDRWIIKPVDGYGTVGVHAGKTLCADEWQALIDEKLLEDYVIQEYCPQFQTLNTTPVPLTDQGDLRFTNETEAEHLIEQGVFSPTELAPFNILTGLYAYNGALGGVYVRAGQDALIVGFRGGVTLGSILVDCSTHHLNHTLIRPRSIIE
jgi:hypothetical protein